MKKLKNNLLTSLKTCVVVSMFAALTSTHADDTEVFYTENVTNNMLFVLDVSGSMKEKIVTTSIVGGGTSSTGGTIGEFDRKGKHIKDDASQNFTQEEASSGGDQYAYGTQLNFEPDNLVATRFRFGRTEIPKGATITNAYLTFTSATTESQATDIEIYIENSASTYAASAYNNNSDWYKWYYYHNYFPKIDERLSSALGPIVWQPTAWNTGDTNTTVDVKDLVQQVVNRPDWGEKANNRSYVGSLAFIFKTLSGNRAAHSRDQSYSNRPRLHVEYQYEEQVETGGYWEQVWKWSWWWGWYRDWEWVPTYSTVTTTDTLDTSIYKRSYSYAYDDAEQEWTSSSSQQQIYAESQLTFTDEQEIGVRFNLKSASSDLIPKDAVITESYIQFTSAGNYSSDTPIAIKIEDTGFAKDYGDSNPKIRSRTYFGNKNWNVPSWTNGESSLNTRTPSLNSLIQHVVERSDWDNSLAFRFFADTETGERIAHAYDAGESLAPVLHIRYQDIGGATSGTGTGTGGTTVITEVNTRLEVMQKALREVLAVEGAPKVNVGIMKYAGMPRDDHRGTNDNIRQHYVGGVVFPVSPIYEKAEDYIGSFESRDNLPNPGDKKVGEFIPDVADEWWPEGGTPIVDALYEAALYYRGEEMHYGKNKNNTNDLNSPGSHPASYFGGSEMDDEVGDVGRSTISNANYKSPITRECQSNYIVLMSDGKPTYYYTTGAWGEGLGPLARTMKNTNASGLASAIPSCLTGNGEAGNTGTNLTSGTCGREITQYLANNDQIPDAGRGGNVGIEGDQTVNTFTIGFGHGLEDGAEEYLRSLETIEGEGGYYKAEHKEELKAAFQNIFETVIKSSGSLSSPGYSVNVKSGLEHEDDIYIPIFDRKNTSRWSGNLKKFKLVDVDGKRKIRGSNGKDAFDELGGFTDDALDYWSQSPLDEPDGVTVSEGGVASLITPVDRKVFSDLVCSSNCDLNSTNNKIKVDNTNLTAELLGVDDSSLTAATKELKRQHLVYFTQGWKNGIYNSGSEDNEPRHYMGDMLHAEPLVITYRKEGSSSGKQQYIFAGTNEGFLHAFDADTGLEKFAFMPKELLKNANSLFKNEGTSRDHKYGIDGVMSYWHEDGVGGVKNKEVDGTEKVYLYFGMRRGGRSYYAMDISDPENPKLVWKVTGSDAPGNEFHKLGQSWSAPYLAKVGLSNGTQKEVVIISGGYDDVEDRDKADEPKVLDDATKTVETTMGNNIYILDAKDGSLLWSLNESMSDNQLKHSIPGGLRMLDVDGNNMVDRLYFADTGGNVWRLDLSESLSKTGDSTSQLTKLASLSDTGVGSRKFYNEPDVAIMSPNGKTIFTVSIGSGFRAHPNDKVIEDKFFVIKDESPYHALDTDFETIEMDEMAEVSISGTGENITLNQNGFDDATKDKGWFLSLPDGEKVLATAITFDGTVTFTTLIPQVLTSGTGIDPCAAPVAYGRLYALNIRTGEKSLNLDDSDEQDPNAQKDIYMTVVKGEIPGKPQVIFNEISKASIQNGNGVTDKDTCTHPVDIRSGKKLSQVTGYDACRLESVYWNNPEN